MTINVHVLSEGLSITPALVVAALERALSDVKNQYRNLEFEDITASTVVQSSYQMSRVQTIIKP